MKSRLLIPLAVAVLAGCADQAPTEPLSRATSLHPLLGAFPGNNGRIAFAGHANGGIHTMNSDGTDVQQLTADGVGPSFNSAGTKVVFYGSPTEGAATEIFVINADGTGRVQLTFNSVGPGLAFPSWSPDGSKIVFQNDADGRIYVMNANGTDATALTAGPDFAPAWSPNGAKIAFSSIRDNGVSEIYVMDADGSNETRLTDNLIPDFDPIWSPNGSRIAFSREGGSTGDKSDIYAMNPDGSGVSNLTNSADRADVTATWSPDGAKIAFISDNTINADIYVMDADGSGQTNISNSAAFEFHLDWQPVVNVPPPACVFGPETYTRAQGAPQRFTETISATPGSYTVDMDDLATSGADATVTLNGVVILEGRGTTGEVGPRHKVVTVTLLASNTLEINLRGKKGSKLKVSICPASGTQCYSNLPAPQLTLESVTDETSGFSQIELNVPNYSQFPDAMFAQAPNLPACGDNTSASRTWVDIYDGNGSYVYGFCSFGSSSDLNLLWFRTATTQKPAEVYITLTDRQCNTTYTSNRVNLSGGL